MSIVIIKIKEQEIPIFKKLVSAFTDAKMRIIDEDDYQEELMAKLIEEGLSSELASEKTIEEEFKKHGVTY